MGGEVTGAKAPIVKCTLVLGQRARGQGLPGGWWGPAGAEQPSLGCCDAGLVTIGVSETSTVQYESETVPT